MECISVKRKKTTIILKEYERDESNVPLDEEDIFDGAGMAKMAFTDNYDEEHCDSLEIFCQHRISSTNQALQQVLQFIIESNSHQKTIQVQDLLRRIENCENLFPSSRHLENTNSAWGEEDFKMRYSDHL